MNATVTVKSTIQRCRHRDFADFVTQCGDCYFLCWYCLFRHLKEHKGQRHFLAQSVSEEKLIDVTMVVRCKEESRRWEVTFSGVAVLSKFFARLNREIVFIELVATRKETASPCTSLLKFDQCRSITVYELELRTHDSVRSFSAWIHCQQRLESLEIGRMNFNSTSFPYLAPGIALSTLLSLSLSEVHLPEGGLGEVVRRVLSLGRLKRLSLIRMKLGERDSLALARVQPQRSLAVLELVAITLLNCQLHAFFASLERVEKVIVRGSLFEAISFSVARMVRMKELRVDCEDWGKLKHLVLIAPAMPQLNIFTVNGSTLPVGSLSDLMRVALAQSKPLRPL